MTYKVTIVFGQEQVQKIYDGLSLTIEEQNLNQKVFVFETEKEKNAFCKGIDEGVGWLEYCVPEYIFIDKSQ